LPIIDERNGKGVEMDWNREAAIKDIKSEAGKLIKRAEEL